MRPLKGRAEPLPRPHIAPGVAPAALSASRPIPQNFAITLPKRHRANAPDRIRTCDLRFRRPTLYPTELQARVEAVGRLLAALYGAAGAGSAALELGVAGALLEEGLDRLLQVLGGEEVGCVFAHRLVGCRDAAFAV